MDNYAFNTLPVPFDNNYKLNYEIQKDYQTRFSSQLYIQRCKSCFVGMLSLYMYKIPFRYNLWSNYTTNLFSRSHLILDYMLINSTALIKDIQIIFGRILFLIHNIIYNFVFTSLHNWVPLWLSSLHHAVLPLVCFGQLDTVSLPLV